MCARVSTYWVDNLGWIHRSDLTGAAVVPIHISFPVYVDGSRADDDVIAPGVLDLQVAYRLSAEIYRAAGQPVPPPGAGEWAFESSAPGTANNFMIGAVNAANWFEVRMARANLLVRTLRKIRHKGAMRAPGAREDGPAIQVLRETSSDWITTSETVTNLRYFDFGAPAGAPAEPY